MALHSSSNSTTLRSGNTACCTNQQPVARRHRGALTGNESNRANPDTSAKTCVTKRSCFTGVYITRGMFKSVASIESAPLMRKKSFVDFVVLAVNPRWERIQLLKQCIAVNKDRGTRFGDEGWDGGGAGLF